MRVRQGLAAVATVGCCLFTWADRAAQAATDLAVAGAPNDLRFVVLEMPSAFDGEFEETLRELLQRNDFRLVHPGVVRSSRVLATVRVEVGDGDALVTITSGTGQTIPLVREVPGIDSPALFRETLAHVILSAVEPLAVAAAPSDEARAPRSSGVGGSDASPDRDSVEPSGPSSGKSPRLSFSLGYRGGPVLVAADRAAMSIGALASMTLETALRPSLALDATYVIPTRATDGALHGNLGLVPLRLRAGLEVYSSRIMSLEPSVGGGIDLLSFSPGSSDASLEVAPVTHRIQPMLSAAVNGRAHLSDSLDVLVSLGLDLDLAPRHWVIATDAGTSSFFQLAELRPYAALGMAWNLGAGQDGAKR